jgi:hypothetical protein
VATLLEKLGFQPLVEETLPVKRKTKAMPTCRFVRAMALACYVGFSRPPHLGFLKREAMLTGSWQAAERPRQSTFWRFLAALPLWVAQQALEAPRRLRQRVWEAAPVELTEVRLDTDTTVHALCGNQMGGRKGYHPNNKGKKSCQPIRTFLAETKEYVGGALRTGDRPAGREIAAHFPKRGRGSAAGGERRLGASRCGLLLLASGGGLGEPEWAVPNRGAQDRPAAG